MSDYPGASWLARYRERVNGHPELDLIRRQSLRPENRKGKDRRHQIDTARCKVALLTGEYDYSRTPAMTEAVAAAIPGSRYLLMKGMGHFPMIENYPGFRPYLLDALDHIAPQPK